MAPVGAIFVAAVSVRYLAAYTAQMPTTPTTPPSPLDTSRCPLCGQANQCAIAQHQPPAQCWCMATEIDLAALEAIPSAERGQRCICPACARGKAL